MSMGDVSVLAQDKQALVMARREHMKAQTAAMSAIKGYLRGEADQATAQKSADDLVRLVTALPDEFPPGTSTVDFPGKSGAKPAIWLEKDKFGILEKTITTEAEKLVAAIKSGDKKAVGDQYMNVGWNGCDACHTAYRQKLD
jgi:cytochrome c556